uniref:Uncharacterized protein n=1 Tax=Phasianus colchicus TaxID=9054 RepID=A0A669NVQ8_PHACC
IPRANTRTTSDCSPTLILPLLAQISSILKLQQQYRGTAEQDEAHGEDTFAHPGDAGDQCAACCHGGFLPPNQQKPTTKESTSHL